MKDLLEFMGVLLIGMLAGGLIYAIVKRKLALGISLIAGLLTVIGLWWWFLSPSTPPTPSVPPAPGKWSWSPTPSGVWEFTKDYWFWAIISPALLFFASNALPEAWMKAAKGMVLTVAVVLVGAMIVHGIWGEKPPSPVLTLKMPANGNSPNVDTKPGYAIDYTGSGFSIHCVYRDGSEGVVGDIKTPCKDGPMLYQYLRDTTGKANTTIYAFVRPN